MTLYDLTYDDVCAQNILTRFWIYVDQKTLEECWLWCGSLVRGYGVFSVTIAGQQVKGGAHRFMWMFSRRRAIPRGWWILHNCPTGDTPQCVNPSHLYCGNHAANINDMMRKKRNVHYNGEKHPKTILSNEDVALIFLARDCGVLQKEIADIFHVSPSTVSQITSGRSWKYFQRNKKSGSRSETQY